MLNLPSYLVNQFVSKAGSLFVGTGLPITAEPSGWAEFWRHMRMKLPGCPENAHVPDLAQYYEDEFDRTALNDEIEGIFLGRSQPPTLVHDALVTIPNVFRLFTTDIDRTLERAAERNARRYKTINNRSALGLSPDDLNIIKLRGDLHDSQSYVVTTRDYDTYLSNYPQMANVLEYESEYHTLLFVGYDFTDFDLRFLARRFIDPGVAKRKHYVLQINPTSAAIKAFERRGLEVIPITATGGAEDIIRATWNWLNSLKEAVVEAKMNSQGVRRPQGPLKHTVPSRPGFKLFGRAEDVDRIVQALTEASSPIAAIAGPAGIGKTTIAVEVGRRFLQTADLSAHRSPFSHVVWFSPNDPRQARWFEDVLVAMLSVSPYPPPERLEEKVEDVRRLLTLRRLLVIIDNFEVIDDPDLTAWISAVPEGAKVLIITRGGFNANVDHALKFEINGLNLADALDLAREEARMLGIVDLFDSRLANFRKVIESTGGNPQMIRLALGQFKSGSSLLDVATKIAATTREGEAELEADPELKFDKLLKRSWALLSGNAKKVLLAIPLFAGVTSVRYDGLQAVSALSDMDMDAALSELVDAKLVELNYRNSRFVTHERTRTFANEMLNSAPELLASSKRACIQYLMQLVRTNVTRDVPSCRYWNSLVTDQMSNIDPDWPCIRQVLMWLFEEKREEEFIEGVMLLVHYMNSRFLNADRLGFVNKALTVIRSYGQANMKRCLELMHSRGPILRKIAWMMPVMRSIAGS